MPGSVRHAELVHNAWPFWSTPPFGACARTSGAQRLTIDEHQPLRLKIDLGLEPGLPSAQDIWSLLFGGVCGFFIGHVVTVEQTPDGAWCDPQAMGLPDIVGQIGERKVGVVSQGHDLISVGFKVMGTIVAASSAWANAARTSLLINPFDRGRGRNAE